MPSLKWKMEYIAAVYDRYHRSDKEEKGRILKELCKLAGYNRKYAIRKLNAPKPDPKARKRRQRSFLYHPRTIEIAEAIWRASGYLCAERLKAAIPLWLPWAKKRLSITPEIEKELCAIGARQLDNRMAAKKRILKKRIYSTTKAGKLLKHMIPVRTSNFDIRLPGFLEIDLVAHCGNSLQGIFGYTLDSTDIQTGWVERRAVLGKGASGVLDALFDIKNALPFRLRGIDSDNGEEFINYEMLDFCRKSQPPVQFTRGRPYKKDDNAHVEQKNWTHVRQLLGWDRYERPEAIAAINDLYEGELRLLQNLFQPSMKLLKKVRVGSRVVRRYDKPKTPLQRIIESGKYDRAKVKSLKQTLLTLDPFDLSRAVDRKLEAIYRMASQKVSASCGLAASKKQTLELKKPNRQPFTFGRRARRRQKFMNRLKRELALSA